MIRSLRPDAVLKVGGSLSHRPRALRRLMTTLEALARSRTLVVVPGGGGFADEVRRADRRFGLDPSSAHWMAILAMDQLAYVLGDLVPRAALVRDPREIQAGRLNVLAPSAWLIRADPLPHSWDVTSDSIAAWVARALAARLLIVIKSADAAPDKLRDLVDPYFARALSPDLPWRIVNGAHPERLRRLLISGGLRPAAGGPARRRARG
jgi:aspartokinase-like uncharacterized kinase